MASETIASDHITSTSVTTTVEKVDEVNEEVKKIEQGFPLDKQGTDEEKEKTQDSTDVQNPLAGSEMKVEVKQVEPSATTEVKKADEEEKPIVEHKPSLAVESEEKIDDKQSEPSSVDVPAKTQSEVIVDSKTEPEVLNSQVHVADNATSESEEKQVTEVAKEPAPEELVTEPAKEQPEETLKTVEVVEKKDDPIKELPVEEKEVIVKDKGVVETISPELVASKLVPEVLEKTEEQSEVSEKIEDKSVVIVPNESEIADEAVKTQPHSVKDTLPKSETVSDPVPVSNDTETKPQEQPEESTVRSFEKKTEAIVDVLESSAERVEKKGDQVEDLHVEEPKEASKNVNESSETESKTDKIESVVDQKPQVTEHVVEVSEKDGAIALLPKEEEVDKETPLIVESADKGVMEDKDKELEAASAVVDESSKVEPVKSDTVEVEKADKIMETEEKEEKIETKEVIQPETKEATPTSSISASEVIEKPSVVESISKEVESLAENEKQAIEDKIVTAVEAIKDEKLEVLNAILPTHDSKESTLEEPQKSEAEVKEKELLKLGEYILKEKEVDKIKEPDVQISVQPENKNVGDEEEKTHDVVDRDLKMEKLEPEETTKPDVLPPNEELKEEGADTKKFQDEPKEEVSAKSSQKHSNNIMAKVKQSLVKAKKAIIGKSSNSKTNSSETKGDIKVK